MSYAVNVPRSVPIRWRTTWAVLEDQANVLYSKIRGYTPVDAQLTATDAVKTFRNPRLLRGRKTPRPGKLVQLGTVLQIDTADPDGGIRYRKWAIADKVPLLWSPSLRAYFIAPGLRSGACGTAPVTARQDKILRTWAQGRGARCGREVILPSPTLPITAPVVQITYRSDKFSHGRMEEYVHHQGAGVVAYISRTRTALGPQLIFVSGGRMRVLAGGLAG